MTPGVESGYDGRRVLFLVFPPCPERGRLVRREEVYEVRQYEIIYILQPDLEEEATKQLIEKFGKIITDEGGEITEFNPWGIKRLAYEIDDFRDGYYVVLKYRAEHAATKELDRVLNITDGVLRHIIIRQDQ